MHPAPVRRPTRPAPFPTHQPASYPGPSSRARRRPRAPTDAVRLAAPALARLSPTFEEPRVSRREMADGELSAELAEAKKAYSTANTNWAADPGNFALKEVKLSADLTVKEIEFKIKEAEVKTLVAQGKGEDDAQVKEAKAARDDAREERNKASARLDEFIKTAVSKDFSALASLVLNSPSAISRRETRGSSKEGGRRARAGTARRTASV